MKLVPGVPVKLIAAWRDWSAAPFKAVRACAALDTVTEITPAIASPSKVAKLMLVVLPQTPACSPVAISAMRRLFAYEVGIVIPRFLARCTRLHIGSRLFQGGLRRQRTVQEILHLPLPIPHRSLQHKRGWDWALR